MAWHSFTLSLPVTMGPLRPFGTRAALIVLAAAILPPDDAAAQRSSAPTYPTLAAPVASLSRDVSAPTAVLVELAGATIGSAAGVALGLAIARPDRCDGEDLGCILSGLGVTGLITLVTAPAGAVIAGRLYDTDPSVFGAALGSIAGAFAGVGAVKVIEDANPGMTGVTAGIVYVLTHGAVTALGSRAAAALR